MSYYDFWLEVFSLNMKILMHKIHTNLDSYRNHNIHHKIPQYDFWLEHAAPVFTVKYFGTCSAGSAFGPFRMSVTHITGLINSSITA